MFSLKRYFNIVHGHHAKSMYIYLLINKFIKLKTIYTIHGSYKYLSSQNKRITNYIFREADHIVFVNKALFDAIPEKQKKIIGDKYSIILNGVDYKYDFRLIDVYNKYSINDSDIVLFHPARFVKEKNHVNLIKSFKKVSLLHPNVKLILAGDGKLREEIRKTIEENDLEQKVKLIGIIHREEVFNFLDRCQLFLMPSFSEGLNVSFLEAFSRKSNILVSNIEQFTFPLQHYNINPADNNIILVDPYNLKSIEDGLISALSLQRLKSEVNTCFSLEKMIEKYCMIYESVLKNKL